MNDKELSKLIAQTMKLSTDELMNIRRTARWNNKYKVVELIDKIIQQRTKEPDENAKKFYTQHNLFILSTQHYC